MNPKWRERVMAKSKRYPLGAFINEFSTAAATLVCYPMVVINVPTAAGKPQ